MTTPLHLLVTTNSAWNALHFRRALLLAAQTRGCRVSVLAPPDEGTLELEAIGIRQPALHMSASGLNPLQDAAVVLRFLRAFRADRPDVVLSFTIKNNIYGALAAKRLGIPFIPTVTGLGTAFLSGGLLRHAAETLCRLAFRGLETVFFQNPDDRDLFVTRRIVTAGQARLLPGTGIDLQRYAPVPLPEGRPVFLLVARLLRDKGVLEFVETARRVRRTYPEARFQLLGPAGVSNRSAIPPETVRAWAEESVVEVLGATDDVRPFLQAATCVVLPSYREGAPRALIEAAAMARPVIATDVPGCRAVVEDGRTGFLCAPRNVDSLVAACLHLLTLSRGEQEELGRAGRRKMIAEYDEAVVVAAYQEAIARALGASSR